MKTTRYRFETAIEQVKEESTQWLKDEFKSILESDKEFTRKADYIGLSIAGIDAKVASIDEEIKELQAYKKKLKAAKEIALTTGAEVFAEYGIDKLEGAGISSITITKAKPSIKRELSINNADALIKLGYFTLSVDEAAVMDAIVSGDTSEELLQYARVVTTETIIPEKLKVNKRRSLHNTIEALQEVA